MVAMHSPGQVTAEQLAPQAQRAQQVRVASGSEGARVSCRARASDG